MSATLRNHSTAAFLLNSDVRGIVVQYERSGTKYLFKTLDPAIKVDDLVVVPTKDSHTTPAGSIPITHYTVVKVVEVDVDPDFDSVIEYKWIAAVFDPQPYLDTVEKEKVALLAVKRAETRRRRNELAENIFEDREAMKQIPFAKVDDAPKFGGVVNEPVKTAADKV